MRRLKKRSLSETTEEEGDDLIDVDDDDDMEVDADIFRQTTMTMFRS